jgi:hypothetical protein
VQPCTDGEVIVPDQIRRIDCFYLTVSDEPWEAASVLAALQSAGVNLLGISVFPHGGHQSELDLIPENSGALRRAAKTAGFKLKRMKTGFLIQGEDRPGPVAGAVNTLANANIGNISAEVFCAGSGHYGGMMWVAAADLRRAAKALGATSWQEPKPVVKPAGYPSAFDETEGVCANA